MSPSHPSPACCRVSNCSGPEWWRCRGVNRCCILSGLQIAQLLKSRGLELWLLTSGLSLAKHARRASALFDAITVSLDGTNRETYAAIRGLDAFDKVLEGIRAAANLRNDTQHSSHAAAVELPAVAGIRRSGTGRRRSSGVVSCGRRCQSARLRPRR